MDKLNALVQKAQHSKFYLWVLNFMLLRTVPFNNPHKIKIQTIAEDGITMFAANTKNNRNHIKGIHACLLATLCEYVTGLSLLVHLSPKEYRIILKNISMTYHYQAKSDVHTKFNITKQEIENDILLPLKNQEALFKEFAIEVYDINKNHICTGLINWQIKAWKNVKTQIN
jgi:acyl-coenzyme A thioesterase PaaI-like protein